MNKYDFTKPNIYVLQLNENKYYIGKTYKHILERYMEHCRGEGSAWTRKYPPIALIEEHINVSEFEEDKITKQYMAKYGIENVRGGAYCRMNMPDSLVKLLYREIWHAQHKCLECGSNQHFVSKCESFVDEKTNTLFRIEVVEKDKTDYYLILGFCFLFLYGLNTLFNYSIGNGTQSIM